MTELNDNQYYQYPPYGFSESPFAHGALGTQDKDTIIFSTVGQGPKGEKGDQGEIGNAIINFESLTEEQFNEIKNQLAGITNEIEDATVIVSGITYSVQIPFDNYLPGIDMIWVDVNGLMLSEDEDYIIRGQIITFIDPIETEGTRIHIRRLKYSIPDSEKNIVINNYTNDIVRVEYAYAQTETNAMPADGDWQAYMPEAIEGYYMWCRTKTIYASGDPVYSYSVSKNGENGLRGEPGPQGATGATGETGADADPLLIDHTEYAYAQSSSGTTHPSDVAFQSTPPEATPGYYMWCRTTVYYTNGQSMSIYSVSLNGLTGPQGESGISTGTEGADAFSYFATCTSSEANTEVKVATISTWEVEPTMHPGLVVDVFFEHGNYHATPKLTVYYGETLLCNSVPIYTQGLPGGYWADKSTITFVYTGAQWYVANTPVYASSATIGNPAGGHVFIDHDSITLNVMDSNNDRQQLAHFGYGSGPNKTGGTSYAPYFTLGLRSPNSILGNYSTAEGWGNVSSGWTSHAEGSGTEASGARSHAEGDSTKASTYQAHAEGSGTIASGSQSHAEGWHSQATGNSSHAEGYNTKAIGNASHSSGSETIAGYGSQFVCGYNNNNKGTNIFEVGNGSYPNRSNALEVTNDGDLIIQNNIEAGSEISAPYFTASSSVDTNSLKIASYAPLTIQRITLSAKSLTAGSGAEWTYNRDSWAYNGHNFNPICIVGVWTNHSIACSVGAFSMRNGAMSVYISNRHPSSTLSVTPTIDVLCASYGFDIPYINR